MQQRVIPIKGMHCTSCQLLVKEKLEELPEVVKADVSLKSNSALLTLRHFPSESALKTAVAAAGYSIGSEEKTIISRDRRVYRDVGLGILLVSGGALLIGLGNWNSFTELFTTTQNQALTSLLVGLTAGISTCMALVGGLVLGISAKYARRYPSASTAQRLRPHLFFNLGRIGGFTLLGAAIGTVGTFFSLNGTVLGWLLLLVSLVMLILGLNLTELFPRLSSVTIPPKLSETLGLKTSDEREYSWHGALTVGVLTFFLPCGFTQAMQLTAVASGSPWMGAVIMGLFALGTTPGLLGVGGLASLIQGQKAKIVFRVIGVGIVALALVNLSSAITLANIRIPKFGHAQRALISADAIELTTAFTPTTNVHDISPYEFTTQVGRKTALVVDVRGEGQGCMSTIMIPGLYEQPLLLQKGKRLVLEFTPTIAGTYQITCAMGISRGTITVEG